MNKGEKNKEKQNMRLSLCLWTVLCGVCMSVMLWYATNKTIVIADVSQEQAGLSVDTSQAGHGEQDTELTLLRNYGMTDSFCVPLPEGIRPENVFMENRYMDRELWIYVQNDEADFYRDNALYGDVSPILGGCSKVWEDGILLKLEMAEVLEYRSTLEGNVLTIACTQPHELYDFLVVLDPMGGGDETGIDDYDISEKALALEVARQVQRNFSLSNVRLYLTRTEDVEVSEQARLEFTEAVGADLYIRIGAQADVENRDVYGIQGRYNEEYFIPSFGNVDLADIVTTQVTIASSNRAVGIFQAAEDSILRDIKVPAMELLLGYLSNPQEEALLEQEVYRQKLAEGILSAVREACKKIEELREE